MSDCTIIDLHEERKRRDTQRRDHEAARRLAGVRAHLLSVYDEAADLGDDAHRVRLADAICNAWIAAREAAASGVRHGA